MTLEFEKGDRLFKIIEAKTFSSQMKRIISKIDDKGKITVFTYTFDIEDMEKDGSVPPEKKYMGLLIKDIDIQGFKFMLETNYKVYPNFKILWEEDYSNLSLKDALELMNIKSLIKSDVPIKDLLDSIKE